MDKVLTVIGIGVLIGFFIRLRLMPEVTHAKDRASAGEVKAPTLTHQRMVGIRTLYEYETNAPVCQKFFYHVPVIRFAHFLSLLFTVTSLLLGIGTLFAVAPPPVPAAAVPSPAGAPATLGSLSGPAAVAIDKNNQITAAVETHDLPTILSVDEAGLGRQVLSRDGTPVSEVPAMLAVTPDSRAYEVIPRNGGPAIVVAGRSGQPFLMITPARFFQASTFFGVLSCILCFVFAGKLKKPS